MKDTENKKRVALLISNAISVFEELTLKDGLSDTPHYKLDQAICEVYDILLDARLTLNEIR